MTAITSKAPIGPGVAASQADWHCRQATEYFAESTRHYKSARSRTMARNRFVADTRHALPSMGLEAFLERFNRYTRESGCFEQAEPIIRELWAELQTKQTAAPIAVGDAAQVALTNAQRLMSIGLQQIEMATRLVQPQPEVTATGIETRGGK